MKLSLILKNLLKQKNLSITTLSRLSSVPTQTIHNWLTGVDPRSIIQIKAVANVLGVDLDYLCFGGISPELNKDKIYDELTVGVYEVVLRKPQK